MTTNRNAISVFLSYAHEDEPLLRQLETHLSLLKRQGLISTWYDRQIIPGTNWAKVIDGRLEQASIILLLVSPDFLASDYCYQVEMKRALERHVADQARVIPIALRPADWKDAPFAHLQALPTGAKAITTWRSRDRAFVDVAVGIRRTIEDLSLLPANLSRAALPAIWNIPYPRNSFFTGRDDLLARLHAQLQAGQAPTLSQPPQAISGLGGIGKTQTAVEYAYRFSKEYQTVFWAYAESRETLVSSYVALAGLLDLPEQDAQEHTITVQAVKRWLQTHSAWLLILDNADELALITEFLPPVLGGHLLLTTRAQAMGRLANRLEIETFSAEQGSLFLLRRAGLLAHDAALEQALLDDREQAFQIATALGGLPLALDQAGAYLEETGCSLSEYQQLYQQYRADLLRERRGLLADHPEPLATTWSISFQRVEEKNPTAAELLRFCAFLSPDAIPEEVLTAGKSLLGPVLASDVGDVFRLNQAIEALRAYSLVQRNPKGKTLSIHRLVQVVLQDAMEEAERRSWAERVILSINVIFPRPDYDTWPQCERLLSQAWTAIQFIEQYQIISEEAEQLLYKMAHYLWDRGRYGEGEPIYQLLLRISEAHLGPEHPEVAWALHGLGDLYWRQGKFIEAEPLLLRAIQIMEQKFGPEDHRLAHMLFGLATLYRIQGKDAQSERLYQSEIRIVEQQLGPESTELVAPLSNLAVLYHHPDKYAEAEQLYQRALQISSQLSGSEQHHMSLPLSGLAILYHEQGKLTEAEPLYKQAIHLREQYYGPEHPEVGRTLNALRSLYLTQGRYAEVESICQRELRIWEQVVTLNPNDAGAYFHRGVIYLYLKKREEARADFARYASFQPLGVGAEWMVVCTSLSKQRPDVELASHLEAIALLDPQDYYAYLCRGVALVLRGKPQEGLIEVEHALHLCANSDDILFWKGMTCAYLCQDTLALESIEQALQAGLPPILLIPLFWLEQESPHFYRKYAEPLLKRNQLL